MPTIEILGLIAAALTTSAFVPQVYKAWKYKSTKDISLVMYLVFLIGIILWFIYGIAINSLSMAIANGVTIILALAILIAKIKFK
ncbi:SemiSWEET transporter [Allomuricauda sp. d1]|uniref:SemiSWEET transporter n=1 Tax=Allomuricauda sp. d1 TaxID=3136725 RepID=UPI0031E06FC1